MEYNIGVSRNHQTSEFPSSWLKMKSAWMIPPPSAQGLVGQCEGVRVPGFELAGPGFQRLGLHPFLGRDPNLCDL